MSVYTGGPVDGPGASNSPVQPWHRWQDWVNLVLGVWLFIAPWIWHSTTASAASMTSSGWDGWILGIIIVVMALWALSSPQTVFPEWINAIAGIWLFIAPWVLGFARVGASSSWNQWAVAIIVFVLSVWVASTMRGSGATTGSGLHHA
jgi:hypothetical protein